MEHGHDQYDEPHDAGGGVAVHTQIAVDEQIGPGLHEFVPNHKESAEIEPSKMIKIGFDEEKAADTTSITQAAVGPDIRDDTDQFCDGEHQFFDAEDKCCVEEDGGIEVEDKSSDEGDKFFDVTAMSMMRECQDIN